MQSQTVSNNDCFVRLRQIIGDPDACPPLPAILPIGQSTWWRWVAEGKAPKGIKLSPGVTVWRAADVYALADQGRRDASNP